MISGAYLEDQRAPSPPLPPAAGPPPVSLEQVASVLAGLNREQRRAVTHGDGPMLVLAGPGTGKTEVLTRRVAWLIATKRALPSQILALTFTQKAALEMQARVDILVPYGQADTAVHTFHAFGDRLLREYALELGLPGDLRLIGRAEAVAVLRENLFELGLERYRPLADPGRYLVSLIDRFWRAKDEGVAPPVIAALAQKLAAEAEQAVTDAQREALLDMASGQAELGRAYAAYEGLLRGRGLIDHADQILLSLRLLRERPAVRQAVSERFRYVLVDEFQDTNPMQLELLLAVAGAHRSVTVVGDDDQAIYAFRGAAVSNMRRFAATQPGLRRVVLRRNYRSRPAIIEASQRLIRHNEPHRLATLEHLDSQPLAHRRGRWHGSARLLAFASREQEADGVAAEIAERLRSGARCSDFAVLLRTNAEADAFMRSLAVRGIAARTSAPTQLAARPEIRVLLAFLNVVAAPHSSQHLYALATAEPYRLGGEELTAITALARRRHRSLWEVLCELHREPQLLSLGRSTQKRLAALLGDVRAAIELSHRRSAGEVLYDFLRRSGRLARLAQRSQAEDEPSSLADIARFFDLVRDQGLLLGEDRIAIVLPHLVQLLEELEQADDDGPAEQEAVAVLTVHRAKGLEFPVVYLCGLVDGRFPARVRSSALSLPPRLRVMQEAEPELDVWAEERRLFYVAMTRACDELVLSYAREGLGGKAVRRPSPFIAEALDVPAASLPVPAAMTADLALAPPANSTPPRRDRPTGKSLSLSFSQLDDYFSCPERYRLRHVAGVPTPAHHALAYGSAMHQAAAAFHLSQAQGRSLSEEGLLSVFARHWSPEGFLSRAHEEARYAAGQAALRRFRSAQLAEGTVPRAIERPFSFSIGKDQLRGRMDRLDATPGGTVITDYKSSDVRQQRKADQKARESLQLQVYALAHQAETGELPAEVRLHFLDSGVVGRAIPEPARLERTVERIKNAAEEIRSDRFEPTPSAVGCGYCPYRSICPESAA